MPVSTGEEEEEEGSTISVPCLKFHERLAYSVGHFYNDLCASMWFSYLLLYLQDVLGFSHLLAGFLLLLGQVVDAAATPLIGYESDRVSGFFRYGKRKSWHLFGTILVTISFPFLFLKCLVGENASDWAQLVYYAPFVTVFQIGWAATQIAHLALVNEIAFDESERVGLNSYRNACTLLSSVVVYGIAWGLFGLDDNSNKFTRADEMQFMILMFSVIGIGSIFSVFFHVATPEARFSEHAALMKLSNRHCQQVDMTWCDWLKEYQFYLVAVAYMLSRLVANVSQTYWPLYVKDTLNLHKVFVAIIPLVVFMSGFFASLIMKRVNQLLGRKSTFVCGLILIGASCIWLWFLHDRNKMQVFGAAIFMGSGSATLLVTSLSMVADLIGEHTTTGAFVYGSMSLADKLSSGTALILVQTFHPCKNYEVSCSGTAQYYRRVMVFLPAGFSIVSLLFLLVMIPIKIGQLRKSSVAVAVDEPQFTSGETQPLLSSSNS